MKIVALVIIVFCASFFSLQYFTQNNTNKSDEYGDYLITEIANLSEKNLLSAVIFFEDVQTLKKGQFSYQVKYQKNLNLNLQSGKVIEKNDLNNEQKVFCLSSESMQMLNSLLGQATICKFEKKQSTGQVCAQVVKPAYMDVLTSTENYQLGYASDSCAQSFIDLCDKDFQFKLHDLIKKISNSYAEKTCPTKF